MRRWFVLGGLLLIGVGAACVGEDSDASAPPSAAVPDAGSSSPNVNDAAAAAGDAEATDAAADVESGPYICDPKKKFGKPKPLNINSALDEIRGRLSADRKSLVFSRRAGPQPTDLVALWLATRETDTGEFGSPRKLTELAVEATSQMDPSFTPDGLRIVFSTTALEGGGTGSEDIVEATRANTQFETPFGAVTRIPSVRTQSIDQYPHLNNDGSVLFFMATSAAGLGFYQAERNPDGSYGAKQALMSLRMNLPGSDSPVGTAKGLAVYTRVFGQSAMYVARRTDGDAGTAFGAPVQLLELDQPGSLNQPSWISDDECTLIFSSNRPNGSGGFDLYEARRGDP